MNNALLKYIDIKLREIERNKKNLYFELKETENFLNILMQIDNDFNYKKIPLLLQNKFLIKTVCKRYGLMNDETLRTFFYLLNIANRMEPSFSVKCHIVLTEILKKLYESENFIYSRYEELDKEYKKVDSFDTQYRKLILETAQSKIESEMITEEELIDFILSDQTINNEYKIKLLKEINKHNSYVVSTRVLLTVPELQSLLNAYGFVIDNSKSLDIVSKKYSESVIKKILRKIRELNLKFSNEILEKILILGTSAETLQNAYDTINENKRMQLISAFGIYNFWINCPYTPKTSETISSSIVSVELTEGSTSSKTSNSENTSVNLNNREINSTEIFNTAQYLQKYPFYNAEFEQMKTILKIPVEKLIKRENLINLYGIKVEDIEGSMALHSPHIITMLDQLIELDLHDYVLEHLSVLSQPQSLPIVLYENLKKGNNITNIKNGKKYLDSSVKDQVGKYKDAVKSAGLVDINIQNREQLDLVLDENGVDKIVPDVFKISLIKYLEGNYRINDYQYVIDGFIFSRIKVLRIISGLSNKIKDFNYDEILYTLTYGKIMNKADAAAIQAIAKNVYDNISKYQK